VKNFFDTSVHLPPSHKYGNLIPMRTTVDIPDTVYRELKGKAAREGRSVKELILRGVESELSLRKPSGHRRITEPLIPSKEPGTLDIDNEGIFKVIPFP
jgi:hypothetical protein